MYKRQGLVNCDFADVTEIMKDSGYAHMGVGRAKGKDKAELAAQQAIHGICGSKSGRDVDKVKECNPVSYTHLDVYKRQVLTNMSATGRALRLRKKKVNLKSTMMLLSLTFRVFTHFLHTHLKK